MCCRVPLSCISHRKEKKNHCDLQLDSNMKRDLYLQVKGGALTHAVMQLSFHCLLWLITNFKVLQYVTIQHVSHLNQMVIGLNLYVHTFLNFPYRFDHLIVRWSKVEQNRYYQEECKYKSKCFSYQLHLYEKCQYWRDYHKPNNSHSKAHSLMALKSPILLMSPINVIPVTHIPHEFMALRFMWCGSKLCPVNK